jgi:hypothetical protein
MNKYKVKSKYDIDRFKKEDDEYLLKLTRPIKPSSIKSLSKEKMYKFIEDVMKNKKMTSILYDTNAQKEINSTSRAMKNCERQNIKKNLKKSLEPVSVVKKKRRKEAYYQMRTEITNYEANKKNYIKDLYIQNYQKYLKIKALDTPDNENITCMQKNRIKGFKRAYENLKLKIDDNKGRTIEKEYSSNPTRKNRNLENYYLFRNNYIDCYHEINLPSIKCDIKDVYSRLYHNKVLLTSKSYRQMKYKKKDKNYTNLFKNPRYMSKKDIFHHKVLQPNPKIKLNLKNALKSNDGKEFTTKITDEVFKKCFDKYSGGPEVLKLINPQMENNSKNISNINNYNNMNISGFVDFYELREKETGNSYLHLAIEGNCPDLLKYFIEKGADINKQNKEGNTPLHLASKNKNMEIIGILLDKKAKLNIPNNDGEIPFDYFTSDMKKQFGLDKVLVINPRTNQ